MASSREAKRRKVEVSQVEISAFCHATEDCTRVEYAVKNLLPPELKNIVFINTTTHEGYYGNPISVLNLKLTSKEHVDLLLRHLSNTLQPLEKSILKATFDLRYDPPTKRLIVRFSKQDLYLGGLKITDSDDVVKLVVHFKNAKSKNDALDYLSRVNLL